MKFPKPMCVKRTGRPLRIAVVYSRNPLPMRRADQMTVAHLLAFLHARGHEVDLYCIETGGKADAADAAWVATHCRNVRCYRHDLLSIARGLFQVPLRLLPLQVGLFLNPAQACDLRKRIAEGAYDVVYTYYLRSAEAAVGLGRPRCGDKGPVTFLALQLSQTLNTRRIAENAPNLFYKLLYNIECRLMARYEAQVWRHFTRTVLIGHKDVEAIQQTCREERLPPIDNYVLVAHGTDIDRLAPRIDIAERPDHIVFTGVMRTPTNIQAVQWFASKVWPLLRAKRPNATWSIVGREPSSEVRRLGMLRGVTVTGTVDDPSMLVAEAVVCINPMQAGGGMQNKLIEYLANGKATVATSVANEGIGAVNGKHLLIADTPQQFCDEILMLLDDSSRRAQLGAAARKFVVEHWTWEANFLKLEDEFYRALNHAHTSQPLTIDRPGLS